MSTSRTSAAGVLTHGITAGARFLSETTIPRPWRNTILKGFGNLYGVNWSEIEAPLGTFESFDEFFSRGLPEGSRPIADKPNQLASPCDGAVHSAVPIERGRMFQIKGRTYSISEFLGPYREEAEAFEGGIALTIYLRPKDYHHVHAPFSGKLTDGCVIPGTLWPVNPWANRSVENLYVRNERVGMRLRPAGAPEHPTGVWYFMVGALCVGGIETLFCHRPKQAWHGPMGQPVPFQAGDELGQFRFGSTIVMLFPPDLAPDLDLQPEQELRLGQQIGTWRSQ